jgi:hypothetical protein
MSEEIIELCSIAAGLVVSHSYAGPSSKLGAQFFQNEKIFQRIFELGRRVKILNPSLMRGTYY